MPNQTSSTVNHDGNNVPAEGGYAPSTSVGFPIGTGVVNMGLTNVTQDANNNSYGQALNSIGDRTIPGQYNTVDVNGNVGTKLGAIGTPTIVQKAPGTIGTAGTTIAVAFTKPVTLGNSIIVVAGAGNNGALTVADTLLNTYSQAVLKASSTTFETAIFYASGSTAGANTVTMTLTSGFAAMEIYEVQGLIAPASAMLDQTSSATATGTTPLTSVLSASTPNEYAFMGIGVGTAVQTITGGAGWVNDSGQLNPATSTTLYSFASFSQFVGNMAPVTPTATIVSEPYAIVAALFRPVRLGVEGTVTIGGYNYTHMTTGTTTLIKTGPGILHSIVVNTGVASATIEIDDALTHTSPVVGILTCQATTVGQPFTATYDIQFNTGLSITTSGATDITIVWK